MTWILGNHTMKFGLMYSKYRKNENALAGSNEGIFSGFNTPGPGVTTAPTAPGGNATQQLWANFLLGTNVSFTQASFDYTADLRQKAFEAFAQDEWKIRPNLRFTWRPLLVLRSRMTKRPISNFVPECGIPPRHRLLPEPVIALSVQAILQRNDHQHHWSSQFPELKPGTVALGQVRGRRSKNDFAPRVGLAWDRSATARPLFVPDTASIRTDLNGTFLQNSCKPAVPAELCRYRRSA